MSNALLTPELLRRLEQFQYQSSTLARSFSGCSTRESGREGVNQSLPLTTRKTLTAFSDSAWLSASSAGRFAACAGGRASECQFPLLTLLDAPDFTRLATGSPKSGPALPPGSGGSRGDARRHPFPSP
jgi:hypothetical protein